MNTISKIKMIKYSRLNELEKHFLMLITEIKIYGDYYIKGKEILFEVRKHNIYFSRTYYKILYTIYIDIFGIDVKDTFEMYLSNLFKEYLFLDIKNIIGINISTQNYWDEKSFL